MEIRLRRALAVLLVAAFAGGCSSTSSTLQGTQARTLDRLNWSEQNHRALNQLMVDHGRGGKYWDESRPGYVVLDWDSTTALFDVEEAVARYQATNLRFKLTPAQFRGILVDSVNGVTRLSESYGSILLADIHADLAGDYALLYASYAGLGGASSLESVQATPAFQDFFARLLFLYDGYAGTPGIGASYAYPWVTYLLAGFTEAEVKVLAAQAIAHELGSELVKVTVRSPAGFPSRSGDVQVRFSAGLRVIPEMQDLIHTFRANGVDVFIVSASFKPIVETFGAPGGFGYGIPAANVIAMELATDANGILLPEYRPGWVKTYRQGKVEAIDLAIKGALKKDWDPIFAAGDSDGDYEMLTGFPGMKLSLVWNRVKGGDIGRLSSQAVAERESAAPRFILQGRNENAGVALPGQASILLGETEPRLLAP